MTSFISLLSALDTKIQNLQTQSQEQIDEFFKKQKVLLTLEQDFERSLQQENEKFAKKIQENRQRIQAENKIEEAISKHTFEFKRKSSSKIITPPTDYRPIVMGQRQSSSRGMRKPFQMNDSHDSPTKAAKSKKLVLNLIRGELSNDLNESEKMDAYCKISINGKTIKSKVCESHGKNPVWNENFEIFEDFSKPLAISAKALDKNAVKEEKLIGEGIVQFDPSEIKSQEYWLEIKRGESSTGKILFNFNFS